MLEKAVTWYKWIALRTGLIAVVAVYSLAAVVSADVVLRKLFNAPFIWTADFTSTGLICVGMFGAAHTLVEGGHIKLDTLLIRLPARIRAVFELFAWLLSLIYVAVLFWITLEQAFTSIGRTTSGVMTWPLFPTKILIPIACVLLAIGMILEIWQSISTIKSASHGRK
jgi:TRAP-type C4-dicarboxylate transport system permease small subunit